MATAMPMHNVKTLRRRVRNHLCDLWFYFIPLDQQQ